MQNIDIKFNLKVLGVLLFIVIVISVSMAKDMLKYRQHECDQAGKKLYDTCKVP
jgi:hypothetical protein